MKQRVEMIFETEETLMLRLGGNIRRAYCERCAAMADMTPPWILAAITSGNEREIFRLIEAGLVYSFESDCLRVCLSCVVTERRKSCEI